MKDYGLYGDIVLKLIAATKDDNYIRTFIENKQNIKFNKKENGANLSILDKLNLMKSMQSDEYKKEIIFNVNKRKELGIKSYQIKDLIKSMHDIKYIREILNANDKIRLRNYEIADILKNIDVVEADKFNLISECIERREEFGITDENVEELIQSTNNIDFVLQECKKHGDELGLSKIDMIVQMMIRNDNENLIKKCIDGNSDLNLSTEERIAIITKLPQKGIAEKWIELRDEYGLKDKEIAKLVDRVILENESDKNKYIEKLESLGLEKFSEYLKFLEDEEYRKQVIKSENDNYKGKITIPEDMTVGMEIECVGVHSHFIKEHNKKVNFLGDWMCDLDSSVESENVIEGKGIEVKSPILTGNQNETTNNIRNVSTILKKFGQYTNDTCGGHIHIGADYLKSAKAYQNLIEICGNAEAVMYIIANEEGTIPRKFDYAKPMSNKLEEALEKGTIDIEGEQDLEKFKETLLEFQGAERYIGVNFMNLEQGGKGTIEFRMPNGTVNADTWIENINLFGGVVEIAQKLAVIQEKNDYKRSKEENEMLENFEKLKLEGIEEREKLEILLKLVIPEEQREIYERRYDKNSRLLNENPERNDELRRNITKKPIRISKNKVGKISFTGENPINADELSKVSEIISRDMKGKEKEEYVK